MRIAVLVKQVPDTWGDRGLDPTSWRTDRTTGEQVVDEIDERALEVALSYRDDHRDAVVVAVGMGPASAADSLRKCLSIGADAAIHLLDDRLAGADATATASALAGALRVDAFDLVIAGNVSTDGRSGVIPAMIAEHLGLPLLSSLDEVRIDSTEVSGARTTDYGVQSVAAALPALISVTERVPEARFPSFKNIMTAKKKPLTTLTGDQIAPSSGPTRSTVLAVHPRAARAAGRIVVDDGQAASKLLGYLVAERLI